MPELQLHLVSPDVDAESLAEHAAQLVALKEEAAMLRYETRYKIELREIAREAAIQRLHQEARLHQTALAIHCPRSRRIIVGHADESQWEVWSHNGVIQARRYRVEQDWDGIDALEDDDETPA